MAFSIKLLSSCTYPYCWIRKSAVLRVNELLRLRVKDLDFDRGQLVIRRAKGIRIGSRYCRRLWRCKYDGSLDTQVQRGAVGT